MKQKIFILFNFFQADANSSNQAPSRSSRLQHIPGKAQSCESRTLRYQLGGESWSQGIVMEQSQQIRN